MSTMSAPAAPAPRPPKRNAAAFVDGLRAASVSVFMIVLIGSYTSIGALAHDLGFPVAWVVLSTLLIWAAPAQVILITSLGAGAPPLEAGIAVGLSGMRLLPMVVALLPVLRTRRTRVRELILPAHFTAVSMWIEALRLAPALPRENRIAFANGLAAGLVSAAVGASIVGYYLAGVLPPTLVAAMLFLTPMSFLTSAVRNARLLSDKAAYIAGVVMAPLLAYEQVGLDLLWTGLIGGSAAYGLYRVREALRWK
jgi:predicted branched-subunit amino acid permease